MIEFLTRKLANLLYGKHYDSISLVVFNWVLQHQLTTRVPSLWAHNPIFNETLDGWVLANTSPIRGFIPYEEVDLKKFKKALKKWKRLGGVY